MPASPAFRTRRDPTKPAPGVIGSGLAGPVPQAGGIQPFVGSNTPEMIANSRRLYGGALPGGGVSTPNSPAMMEQSRRAYGGVNPGASHGAIPIPNATPGAGGVGAIQIPNATPGASTGPGAVPVNSVGGRNGGPLPVIGPNTRQLPPIATGVGPAATKAYSENGRVPLVTTGGLFGVTSDREANAPTQQQILEHGRGLPGSGLGNVQGFGPMGTAPVGRNETVFKDQSGRVHFADTTQPNPLPPMPEGWEKGADGMIRNTRSRNGQVRTSDENGSPLPGGKTYPVSTGDPGASTGLAAAPTSARPYKPAYGYGSSRDADKQAKVTANAAQVAEGRKYNLAERRGNLTEEQRLKANVPGYAITGLAAKSNKDIAEAQGKQRIAEIEAGRDPNGQAKFKVEMMAKIAEVAKSHPELAQKMWDEVNGGKGGGVTPDFLTPKPGMLTEEHSKALEAMKSDPNSVHKYLVNQMHLKPGSPEYMAILNNTVYPETNTGHLAGQEGGYRSPDNLAGNTTWENWGAGVDSAGNVKKTVPRMARDSALPSTSSIANSPVGKAAGGVMRSVMDWFKGSNAPKQAAPPQPTAGLLPSEPATKPNFKKKSSKDYFTPSA